MQTQIQDDNRTIVEDYEDEEEDTYEPKQPQVINGKLYKPGMFLPGQSGNPGGRPKGTSMKTYAREYLASLTEAERLEYLAGIPKLDIWRMAEGLPEQDTNVSISVPKPILGGLTQLPSTVVHEVLDTESQNSEDIGHIGGDEGG